MTDILIITSKIMKRPSLAALLLIAACVTRHDPYDDYDWDYVFPEEGDYGDYCGHYYEPGCVYYPPYYF